LLWVTSTDQRSRLRCMSTAYNIDSYQQTYFVIDSFQQLFDMTAPDFAPPYAQLKGMHELAACVPQPEDIVVQP
jgi:phenylalanine-4-hydroxylase